MRSGLSLLSKDRTLKDDSNTGTTQMNTEEAQAIVVGVIAEVLGNGAEIASAMPLIGGQAQLDSMKLVEVCLALEDKADDLDFEFDWTSDATMSRSRSMFRTVETLAAEFQRQATAKA